MSHPPQHLREGRLLQAAKQFVPRHLTAAQSGRRDAAEQTCQQAGGWNRAAKGGQVFPFSIGKGDASLLWLLPRSHALCVESK